MYQCAFLLKCYYSDHSFLSLSPRVDSCRQRLHATINSGLHLFYREISAFRSATVCHLISGMLQMKHLKLWFLIRLQLYCHSVHGYIWLYVYSTQNATPSMSHAFWGHVPGALSRRTNYHIC